MIITINPQTVTVTVGGASVSAGFGTPMARDYIDHDAYTGSYEITPTDEAQTIPTANLLATQDFVVQPIPTNYGLVTYNGAIITVS